jgi:hypothetical protein
MKKKIIKEIDDFIFKQIDNFKESQAKLKVDETLNALSEQQLKIFSQVSSYLIVSLPILVLLVFYFSNSMLKSDISLKNEILNEINYYNSKKSEVEASGRKIISPHKVLNMSDFKSRIDRLTQRKSINASAVRIANFEALEQSGNISKSEASLNIKEFTSKNLSDFILGLLQSEKVKIQEIRLKRNNKKNLISGNVKITHYGKVSK